MAKLVAACVGLGALSLALPSELSYDPWAWLVWGREIAHLELDTAGGPSWKPLPVLVTALASPLSAVHDGLPEAVWMTVARAGSLLALALAFRLTRRLCGAGPAGSVAGLFAACVLLLTPDWLQFAAQGSEAPIAIALMLCATERQLDARPEQAVVLGTLACLLRPELFPLLVVLGALLWRGAPQRRPLLLGALALLAVAWIVPEWIGSGNPLDAGAQARSEPAWSLSHAASPWLRALGRLHHHTGLLIELLASAAVAWALVRRNRPVLAMAAASALLAAMFVAMTQAGFSGNPRYALPALVLWCVLAGVGLGRLLEVRWNGLAAGAAVALALAVVSAPGISGRVERVRAEAGEVGRRMELHRQLAEAVRRAGGAEAVNRFGPASVNRALETHLAWELARPIAELETATGQGVVFSSFREFLAGRRPIRRPPDAIELARAGSWHVYLRRSIYTTFAGTSQLAPGSRNACLQRVSKGAQHRHTVTTPLLACAVFKNPDAWSNQPYDHRPRLPGSRQREHDPADHRGWPRGGRRDSQALLGSPPQVPPHPQG
jgi:hypothetical protein